MKNTLMDLNNHLFEVIERLNDDWLSDEDLGVEIQRAEAITKVAGKVIENADLALKAEMFRDDRLDAEGNLPKMLGE